jgi:outer membrane receptor for ferrienterochelin and colicins
MVSLLHKFFTVAVLITSAFTGLAQTASISGKVIANGKPLELVSIRLSNSSLGTITDSSGVFSIKNLAPGSYTIAVSTIGHRKVSKQITLKENENSNLQFELSPLQNQLEDVVVVTGTLKEVKRMESPVPVEVYTPQFFRKNPTPNIFDALQNVNGVRPQLNCNICNTGDIHINGLEGPYTMVLIDGMP